jgi:hypothetical protein
MNAEVARRCVELMETCPSLHTLDITGGAPEMNDQFRYLVGEGRRLGKEVIDRCNLTVLSEPGQEDLSEFLAANKVRLEPFTAGCALLYLQIWARLTVPGWACQVRVVASLPCYSEKNVDTQRGRGVFDKSIRGLLQARACRVPRALKPCILAWNPADRRILERLCPQLNQLGYGVPGTGLALDLVYNPLGAFLPPEQGALEAQYRAKLAEDFGIVFRSRPARHAPCSMPGPERTRACSAAAPSSRSPTCPSSASQTSSTAAASCNSTAHRPGRAHSRCALPSCA